MYPVQIGKSYRVTFPLGGTQVIECTEPNRTGFKGTNLSGKLVTVRSYRMVEGLGDYVAPPEPPAITPLPGHQYTMASGKGVRLVDCDCVYEGTFTDLQGKSWPFTRIVGEGVCKKPPKVDKGTKAPSDPVTPATKPPSKPRRRSFGKREIEFARDGATYVIKWTEDSSYQLLDGTGSELFRCNRASELFSTLEEL